MHNNSSDQIGKIRFVYALWLITKARNTGGDVSNPSYSDRLVFFVALVICTLVSTCLTLVALSIVNSTVPPSTVLEWIIRIMDIIFSCILAMFTSASLLLVFMFGFTAVLDQRHSIKQEREHSVPGRRYTSEHAQMEDSRRRGSQLRRTRGSHDSNYW